MAVLGRELRASLNDGPFATTLAGGEAVCMALRCGPEIQVRSLQDLHAELHAVLHAELDGELGGELRAELHGELNQ